MSKRTIIVMLLALTLVSSIAMMSRNNLVAGADPSKLLVTVGPLRVPANGEIYECIFVQLQDATSKPARAIEDTVVSLSSSVTSMGKVDPQVTIVEGSTYATARFYTTYTPGTTSITATATGYGTVSATLITVAPVPRKISVYGFPDKLPADGGQYDALVVQLQDASGNPAKAPIGGIDVTLTSSNSTVASVPGSVTIVEGQTYALSTVTCNTVGSADITGQASGYDSDIKTTIYAQRPATTPPTMLRVYVAPPKVLADYTARSIVVIELLNSSGNIVRQPLTPIIIHLSSSNPNLGAVQDTLEISADQVYAKAVFTTTYQQGATTITASATDLTTDTEIITTIGPIPYRLVLYCNPSALPADEQAYNAIQVQLQDSAGNPALDPKGDVTVSLYSSNTSIGTVPISVTIPFGKSYASTTFTSTNAAGLLSLTGLSSGYTLVPGQMRTYAIGYFIGVLQMCVRDFSTGLPLSGATVLSLSQPRGMSTLTGMTNETGYIVFPNSRSGNYTFSVDMVGYMPKNETFNYPATSSIRTISLVPINNQTTQTGNDLTFVWLILIVVVIIAVVVVFALSRLGVISLPHRKQDPYEQIKNMKTQKESPMTRARERMRSLLSRIRRKK